MGKMKEDIVAKWVNRTMASRFAYEQALPKVMEVARQLREHKGPYYEKWLRNWRKALERLEKGGK